MADINLHLSAAEEALGQQDFIAAEVELDKAEISFEELRSGWPDLVAEQQGLLSAMAKPLSAKLKSLQARLPKVSAVSMDSDEAKKLRLEEKELDADDLE